MAADIGDPEVESFLRSVRSGWFEINPAHPNIGAYQTALQTYNMDKRASALPSPHIGDYMKGEIDTALSLGAIEPNREYIEKLASDIKDNKITEQDIDRAESGNDEKKTLKEIILNKLADKTLNELVEELFSVIKSHGLCFVSLLFNIQNY